MNVASIPSTRPVRPQPPVGANDGRPESLADAWESGYERVPTTVTRGAGAVVAASGKYFVPAGEILAGAWLANDQGQQAARLLAGNNGRLWKGASSTSDRILGTACHGLLAAVGVGIAVHGALRVVDNVRRDVIKR